MPWMGMAQGGNIFDLILQSVGFAELPKMRAVSTEVEASLAEGRGWMLCARTAQPNIEFSREHFLPADRLHHIALVLAMNAATPTADGQVIAASRVDTRQMCKQVLNARRSGGRYFLAHLRFPHEHVVSSMSSGCGSQMCFAEPIVLPQGLAGGALYLHFAIRDGALLVAARDDGAPPDLIPEPDASVKPFQAPHAGVVMDLKCVDPAIFMQYRGLPLPMNEAWEPATSGMLDFRRAKLAAANALQHGAACVFCLRNDQPQEQATSLAHCLNIDRRN